MSQENVEIVRRIYEKWEDLVLADPNDKSFDDFFDPAIEVDNSNAVFDGAVYRGRGGLREYLALLREAWTSIRLEPEEFIRAGEDQVVVAQRIFPRSHGRCRGDRPQCERLHIPRRQSHSHQDLSKQG
jgi:ketosteroid isomerase-like protein